MSAADDAQQQWFYFAYQCQNCDAPAIRYLVRRNGKKLTLSGRDPLEVLPTPSFLPKETRDHFKNALVAHHAGQTLAGVFLLRVSVEQFWRALPECKALLAREPRATGEELGQVYSGTLPVDFRSRFPSLSDVYGKLSEAMHGANGDADLFEEMRAKIVDHFDARRLFKLYSVTSTSPSTPINNTPPIVDMASEKE
jgi:hypothetical protein